MRCNWAAKTGSYFMHGPKWALQMSVMCLVTNAARPNFSQPSGCNRVSNAISWTCLDRRLRRIPIRLHPAHCDKSKICHNLRDFATKFVRNPGWE